MNTTKFEIGDAVNLKTIESVAMLIAEVHEESNSVVCVWHDNNGAAQKAVYPIDLIEYADNDIDCVS